MGLRLPQAQLSNDSIQRRQNVDNSRNIIGVVGNNPYANAISNLTPIIADALQKRAQLKQQAQQTALISKALESGQFPEGIQDPTMLLKTYDLQTDRQKALRSEGPSNQVMSILESDFKKDIPKYNALEVSGVKLNIIKDENPRANGNLDLRQKSEELQLNSAFRKESEPYKNSLLGYKEAMAAVNQKTGVGDSSLVRAIVKVAEGKGARVSDADVQAFARTGNIPENLKGEFLKASTGARLSDEVRSQFRNLLQSYYDAHRARQEQIEDEFTQTAKNYGFNPNRVVMKFRPREEYLQQLPSPVSTDGNSNIESPPVVGGTFNGQQIIGVKRVR